MTKEIALKVVSIYKAEKMEAEKNRTGMFWLNPVFSDAYNGNYKTVIDGEEYTLALLGISGYSPDGYAVRDSKGEEVTIK